MQDTELFMSLAEIAGVFVGFGALIAVRGGGPANAVEVAAISWVVMLATIVVASALAPVVLGRFGVAGHGLWLVCSVFALALFWGGFAVSEQLGAEQRAFAEARAPLRARAGVELVGVAVWLPATVALVLVVLGAVPEQETALYFAAVVLFLMMDALLLLMVVFHVGLPTGAAPRPEEAGPAPGPAA
jgi:hypothetical protein